MAVFHLALRYLRSFKIFVRGVTHKHKHKATKAHKAQNKWGVLSLSLALLLVAALPLKLKSFPLLNDVP